MAGDAHGPPGLWTRVANLRAVANLPRALARTPAENPVCRIDAGPYPLAYVQSPDAARAVLDQRVPGVAERGRFFEEISRVIGPSSLVTCAGAEHRRLRRLIAPGFRPEQVGAYSETMITATTELTARWRPGEEIDVGAVMSRLTLEIAARALLGLSRAEQLEDFASVLAAGSRVFYRLFLPRSLSDVIWRSRLSSANRTLFAAQERVDRFVTELVAARLASVPSRGEAPANLLDVLLAARDDDGGRLSPSELRDQVVTFLFAGHETTAQALCWLFVALARHPAAAARLSEELDEVLGGRRVAASDVAALRYTRAVVRETLRLFPPAWFLSREMAADAAFAGCALARGTLLVVSPLVLHRDARHWHSPLLFAPERWLERDDVPAAYLPFGVGRRNCIGSSFAMSEMILVTATIAQQWEVGVVGAEAVRPRPTVTLRPRRRVRAVLRARPVGESGRRPAPSVAP